MLILLKNCADPNLKETFNVPKVSFFDNFDFDEDDLN